MTRTLTTALSLLAALVLLVACNGPATPPPEAATTTEDLVAQTAAKARAAARPGGDAATATPAPRPADAAPTRPPATATPTPRPAPSPPKPVATPSPTGQIAFPKGKPITYVAIGASDTVGVGAANPARDGWVPQLHRRLPPGSRLVNLGVSGTKLSEAVQLQLPKAIEARPDLVTVWNVVNDLNANVDMAAYERDLDRLLRELTNKTGARVLVGNVPDLAGVPAYTKLGIPPDELRKEAARWNQVIARTAQKYPGRVYVVDLYARSAEIEIDQTLVAGDDFHPSAGGYARLADVFWEHMVASRLVAPA
ncbi:MAG TPA: SGNH/GDSL hydrolase family protein [Chloroflexota bacterium]|jgi:lysophospholipase L1-like esterase|nr:SGNH/GDSL hydrolase family protein [Chloroflexota bacterium]